MAKQYFDSINKQNIHEDTSNNLQKQFSLSNKEIVKILSDLLKFDPHKRVSAKECLKNKIFDSIRVPELE